jgi:hypothetical protein
VVKLVSGRAAPSTLNTERRTAERVFDVNRAGLVGGMNMAALDEASEPACGEGGLLNANLRTLIVLLLVLASPATAATITVTPQTGDTPAVVMVQGDLRDEDIDDFRFKVAKLSSAVVALESDGGSLLAGIRIGEIIRLKGFVTVVANGARCASACATAWLGGVRRFMGEQARIGFHAAYRSDTTSESGMGNAVLGAYLNSIGLSEAAVAYVTMADPNSMTWLTLEEAAKYGIDVH